MFFLICKNNSYQILDNSYIGDWKSINLIRRSETSLCSTRQWSKYPCKDVVSNLSFSLFYANNAWRPTYGRNNNGKQ